MQAIAIIPARGGSKRIPRKNIKLFNGAPMIAHAIAIARASGLFSQVVVSTEDAEIAAVARAAGAETPFVRPEELADDQAATVPVIAHAVEILQQAGVAFNYACCIYPCVPFMQADDLKNAFDLLECVGAKFSFPVAEFPSAVQRALRRTEDGRMAAFLPQYELTRTQDLEAGYFDAGQFYWGKAGDWRVGSRLHSDGAGYVIPSWRVVDIDTPDDWDRAERLHKTFFLHESQA